MAGTLKPFLIRKVLEEIHLKFEFVLAEVKIASAFPIVGIWLFGSDWKTEGMEKNALGKPVAISGESGGIWWEWEFVDGLLDQGCVASM